MLRRLEIEQYGLIDRAAVAFSDAATIFTGETGSGKTMILGALAFALGARAGADVVRRGARRSSVTLAFEPLPALAGKLERDGYETDPGEDATIVREMSDAGKSALRLNGRACTASYVREIASEIVEIVGQHEAQRLLAPAYHLELLDRFGGSPTTEACAEVAAAYAELSGAQARLDTLLGDERALRARYDDACYALEEISGVAPEPGEDLRLTERRRVLDNVERVSLALRSAHEALAGDDNSASGALGAASAALEGIADMSAELRDMAAASNALQSETMELATRLARELEGAESDPGELDEINARLDALDRLRRKYGGSLESVLRHLDSSRAAVEAFDHRDESVATLRDDVLRASKALDEKAAVLSALRRGNAARLARAISPELKDLAMTSARFDVAFAPLEAPGAQGAESVELVFAANAGEPLRPLAKIASGGELSRVLLAIIVVLAASRDRTALVFDEIDAGIGGATATAVGARIGRLARDNQVISVTHLAQLATWADKHYVLEKREAKSATTISVREIASDGERVAELARMLSGEGHEAALAHARMLLDRATRAGA